MSSCTKVTDNRYWNSPPKMADGRLFTDQQSPSRHNFFMARSGGFRSLGDGRFGWKQVIQERGQEIHQDVLAEMRQYQGAGDATSLGRDGFDTTMVPEFQYDVCRPDGCSRVSGNLRGTGLGRLQAPDDLDTTQTPPATKVAQCGVPAFDAALSETQRNELRKQGRSAVLGGGDPQRWRDVNIGVNRR